MGIEKRRRTEKWQQSEKYKQRSNSEAGRGDCTLSEIYFWIHAFCWWQEQKGKQVFLLKRGNWKTNLKIKLRNELTFMMEDIMSCYFVTVNIYLINWNKYSWQTERHTMCDTNIWETQRIHYDKEAVSQCGRWHTSPLHILVWYLFDNCLIIVWYLFDIFVTFVW